MTTDDATALRTTLQALVDQWTSAPDSLSKNVTYSRIQQTLDPVREFFRPYLATQFDDTLTAAVAALLTYCNDDSIKATQIAMTTPVVAALVQTRNCFADGSRAIIADANTAISILTTYIGS
jgi:hypothetical protein